MSKYQASLDVRAKEKEWETAKCDKYDYMIAVFCGLAAGIVDALFVGTPGAGSLGALTDKGADTLVQKVAVMLWNGDGRSTGKPHHAPDTLEKAISYLEQAFPVNYDARYSADLKDTYGALSGMTPKNHHLLSISHSPDIIGLLFSVIDQFTGAASFIEHGKLIRLYPIRDARNYKSVYMQGTNFESKIFCGICNWLGHLASDLCGSSSTRKVGKTGRGAGIPIPFYELFLMMNFGDFDGQTFAEIAVDVFEQGGYDFRHGAAMAIPVLITDLSIKLIWVFKKHYFEKKEWRDCKPSKTHADLRMMLLIGNGTLCAFDGIDAAVRSGGNALAFILHMNLVAWARLIMLVFRELKIRYGARVDAAVNQFLGNMGLNDKEVLRQYYNRMNQYNMTLEQSLKDFISCVEKEYREFIRDVNNSLNHEIGTSEDRRISSVQFAKRYGVPTDRIFENPEDMRYWLGEGWK